MVAFLAEDYLRYPLQARFNILVKISSILMPLNIKQSSVGGETLVKQRKSRKRRKAYTLGFKALRTLLITSGILLGITYLTRSKLVVIKEVYVTDYNLTEIEHIDAAKLEADLLELYLESNYFLLSPIEVREKVISSSPFIEHAYVTKLFPEGLKVEIVERKASIQVEHPRYCALLDREGYVLELWESDEQTEGSCINLSEVYSLPKVVTSTLKAEFILDTKSTYHDVGSVLVSKRILKEHGYEVSDILLDQDVYVMTLDGGQEILLSSLGDPEAQQKRLIVILREINTQKLTFQTLDVRYERPVITR